MRYYQVCHQICLRLCARIVYIHEAGNSVERKESVKNVEENMLLIPILFLVLELQRSSGNTASLCSFGNELS